MISNLVGDYKVEISVPCLECTGTNEERAKYEDLVYVHVGPTKHKEKDDYPDSITLVFDHVGTKLLKSIAHLNSDSTCYPLHREVDFYKKIVYDI